MARIYRNSIQAWFVIAMLLPGYISAADFTPPASRAPVLSQLSLTDAETLWAARSREIKIARAAVEGAKADTLSAGQRPNPQLSLMVSSLSPQSGLGSGGVRDKMTDTMIGVNQVIERGDKREHRMRGAQSRLDATRQDLFDTLRSQRLTLQQAY